MLETEKKTMKVLDICVERVHLVCIMHIHAKRNPYKLYWVWKEAGYHKRRKLAEYQNFVSVIEYIRQYCHNAHWGFKESYFDWGK